MSTADPNPTPTTPTPGPTPADAATPPPSPRNPQGLRLPAADPAESSAVAGPRREVEVGHAPSSSVVLARGVVAAARARGTTTAPRLPDVDLVLRGIHPDPERLTAYQQEVGEAVTDVLPSGFLHVLAFPLGTAMMARADFPLPALGMVHVANRAEVLRAVRLGEELTGRLHAERLAPHRRGVTVDLVAELAVGDDVVWRGVSTYLAKGVRLPDADAPPVPDRAPFSPPTPTGQWRLGRDVGRRYAAVSGDHNPIHTNPVAAKVFGFPRPIAHGMYTAARALADVGVARGDAYVWEVEFASPVLLPSTVSVRVAADDAGPAAGAGGFRFTGWSRSGKVHLTGAVRPLP